MPEVDLVAKHEHIHQFPHIPITRITDQEGVSQAGLCKYVEVLGRRKHSINRDDAQAGLCKYVEVVGRRKTQHDPRRRSDQRMKLGLKTCFLTMRPPS